MRGTIFLVRVISWVNCYKLVRFAHNWNNWRTGYLFLETISEMRAVKIVQIDIDKCV